MKKTIIKLIVISVVVVGANIRTASALLFTESMNLHTMMEATTSVFTTLADTGSGIIKQPINWSGSFDQNSWSYSGSGIFGGKALQLNYSGSLSGQNGQDIIVSFTGNGSLGNDPLTMTGETRWFYDSQVDDYIDFDFEQLTKIGASSLWGWVLGAETVVGVGAGVAVGVGVGTILPPAGLVAGVKVGALATGLLVGVSAGAKSLLTDSPPPKPTVALIRPTPNPGDLFPNDGTIIVGVGNDGLLVASDYSGRYRGVGSVLGGSFSGTTSVPEPSTLMLLTIGAGIFGFRARRMHNNA